MKIDLSCHTSPFIFLTVHIKKVMYALLEAERPLTIQDIANRVNCSGRQVYYDLEQTHKKAADSNCINYDLK